MRNNLQEAFQAFRPHSKVSASAAISGPSNWRWAQSLLRSLQKAPWVRKEYSLQRNLLHCRRLKSHVCWILGDENTSLVVYIWGLWQPHCSNGGMSSNHISLPWLYSNIPSHKSQYPFNHLSLSQSKSFRVGTRRIDEVMHGVAL